MRTKRAFGKVFNKPFLFTSTLLCILLLVKKCFQIPVLQVVLVLAGNTISGLACSTCSLSSFRVSVSNLFCILFCRGSRGGFFVHPICIGDKNDKRGAIVKMGLYLIRGTQRALVLPGRNYSMFNAHIPPCRESALLFALGQMGSHLPETSGVCGLVVTDTTMFGGVYVVFVSTVRRDV